MTKGSQVYLVSTHSRPKAAGMDNLRRSSVFFVSTHSRPKAAGLILTKCVQQTNGFNTQPPEGGWRLQKP